MSIAREPLTWEVLDFWRETGLPLGPIIHSTLVVSRDAEGAVDGFAAIGNTDSPVKLLIEPLAAKNAKIAVAIVDELEKLLMERGMPGYAFYIAKDAKPAWARTIRRLCADGVFHKLGESETHHWYARKFGDE